MSMKSLGAVDPRTLIGKGTVGLLNATGTYDITRYPWAYDCWKRQQQTHWMGEEVPLGEGWVDWPRYVGYLRECGYTGYFAIEREVGENALADIKKAVDFLKTL